MISTIYLHNYNLGIIMKNSINYKIRTGESISNNIGKLSLFSTFQHQYFIYKYIIKEII